MLSYNFPSNGWFELGLLLGLHYETLTAIEYTYRSCDECLSGCLAAWLMNEDEVEQKGGPSWCSLAAALNDMEQEDIATNIMIAATLFS